MSYATEDNNIIKDNEMLISMNPEKRNIKFSKRWFEIDPGYAITKFLSKIKILRIKNA